MKVKEDSLPEGYENYLKSLNNLLRQSGIENPMEVYPDLIPKLR